MFRFRDWASLDKDLVDLIGWRVLASDLQDYVSFPAVCPHWTNSTIPPHGRGILDARFHPRQWMMLPEGHGLYPGHPNLHGSIRFFNLSTGAFVRVYLPLLDDHAIFGSIDGLLLLHRKIRGHHNTSVRLLHPFTGDVAELPPLASILPQIEFPNYYTEPIKRALVMSVRASVAASSTGAITVMLALNLLRRVAYAAAGDQRWTLSAWEMQGESKSVAFQGKLYVMQFICKDIEEKVCIYQIDPPPHLDAAGGQSSHLPLR